MKNKKINVQKIFCFISFLFILSCCLFYGTRFIKLYLDNKESEIVEENSLVKTIKEANGDNPNFKMVNGKNYFTDQVENNYLEYSNILWRVIRINSDNSITAISDHPIATLAYGKNLDFEKSHINKWLNSTEEDLTGILEKSLNNVEKYLQKTESCNDKFDELTNTPCNVTNQNNYFSLLSIPDYLNAGSKKSYLNNSEYFYLNNSNNESNIWYVSNDGSMSTSNGEDIYGIKPVITIKANIDYIKGDGSLEKPYKIEEENNLFGSYVKLDNDIWRIFEINDNKIKLVLNNYLNTNNNDFTYQYSLRNSFYNDTNYNSLAYYLNHNFLNSLSYKDIIEETEWSNGEYNNTNNYDYIESLKKTIKSKVGLTNIGNIILNPELENYYTMTQTQHKGMSIYTFQKDKNCYQKNISAKLKIIPAISIEKLKLTKGKGTINEPYEME